MRRPLIVYVSGAPGSGKTTLAAKIAAELFIPHIIKRLDTRRGSSEARATWVNLCRQAVRLRGEVTNYEAV